jgi:hypothetical protein
MDFAFLMGPWALSLGLSLSHHDTPTPKYNTKRIILFRKGLISIGFCLLLGGLMKLGP